jgi:prevent-host-death family protein
MVVRNISQAKAVLSALIQEVMKGNEVILAKAGKPVARMVAYQGPSQPRKPVPSLSLSVKLRPG